MRYMSSEAPGAAGSTAFTKKRLGIPGSVAVPMSPLLIRPTSLSPPMSGATL